MWQDAVASFFAMREKASGPMISLPPAVLAELLAAVASSGLPADLLKILRCLETDQQQLPAEAMCPLDEEGHTFLSAWLVPRYSLLRARVNKPSLGTAAGESQLPSYNATYPASHLNDSAYVDPLKYTLSLLALIHVTVVSSFKYQINRLAHF